MSQSELAVGCIGAGGMGSHHIGLIAGRDVGARVVAIADPDRDRAAATAASCPGVKLFRDAFEMIGSQDVEAVVIASPPNVHAEQVLACIAAGKPVLCEKPLAMNSEECRRIVDAEASGGRQLVHVAFMRRYDPSHVHLKQIVDAGEVGGALLLHCVHRIAAVPAKYYTTLVNITEGLIHELDLARWFAKSELRTVRTFVPRATSKAPHGVADPIFYVFEADNGMVIDVEVFLAAGYGYDIQVEVVGERGTAALDDFVGIRFRQDNFVGARVPRDNRERFAEAYQRQLEHWTKSVLDGDLPSPNAWDGYAAQAVSDAAQLSLATGEAATVMLGEKPGMYNL